MNDRAPHIEAPVGISIGAMSKATGIPANTLRTWERRYGFPEPDRTASGQRLYDPGLIDHLRLVAKALDHGHRPRQVLALDRGQLERLLGVVDPATPSPAGSVGIIDQWLAAVQNLDGRTLDQGFRSESARLGVLSFLVERAGPLMVALGQGWRAGAVKVYQEHWASERLRRFLSEIWEPMAQANNGPTVVGASLPGDRHDLGLHMACAVMAMCGWNVAFIGKDTPVDDIAAAVTTSGSRAVIVSISSWADEHDSHMHLEQLRARLDPEVAIVVGGGGSPGTLPGIEHLSGLEALFQWASGDRD